MHIMCILELLLYLHFPYVFPSFSYLFIYFYLFLFIFFSFLSFFVSLHGWSYFNLCTFLVLILEPEIATPPLNGSILPGVTRKSLLELGASWVSVLCSVQFIATSAANCSMARGSTHSVGISLSACNFPLVDGILQ